MTEPRDELLERYADAVAHDTRRPAAGVRDAVRAHAQMLADARAAAAPVARTKPRLNAANQSNWNVSMVASLAVVALAGLLYVQIDRGQPDDREAALGVKARGDATAPPVAALGTQTAVAPATSPAAQNHPTQAHQAAQMKAAAGPSVAAAQRGPAAVERAPTGAPSVPPATMAERQEASKGPVIAPVPDHSPTAVLAANTTPAPAAAESAMAVAAAAPRPALAIAAAPATAGAAMPQRPRQVQARAQTLAFLDAVRAGHVAEMEQLLAQGVDVNTRDGFGDTALMIAVGQRQAATVRTLLDRGANRSLTNRDGLTAVHIAQRLGLADIQRLLLSPP